MMKVICAEILTQQPPGVSFNIKIYAIINKDLKQVIPMDI